MKIVDLLINFKLSDLFFWILFFDLLKVEDLKSKTDSLMTELLLVKADSANEG